MSNENTEETEDTPRETRTSIRRGLTRAAIVAATAEAIQKDGEEAFSLDEVAAGLGLSKPALYYYFSTREALLFEVFVAEMTKTAQLIHDAVEQTATAEDAIEAFVRTFLAFHIENPRLSRFLQHRPALIAEETNGEGLERLHPINDLLMSALEARIRAARDAGKATLAAPRRLAFLTFTSITGLVVVKEVVDDPDHDALVGDLIQMLQARLHV